MKPKRKQAMAALGVFEGPPEEKPDVAIPIPQLIIVNCRKGFTLEKLQPFLEPLRQMEVS